MSVRSGASGLDLAAKDGGEGQCERGAEMASGGGGGRPGGAGPCRRLLVLQAEKGSGRVGRPGIAPAGEQEEDDGPCCKRFASAAAAAISDSVTHCRWSPSLLSLSLKQLLGRMNGLFHVMQGDPVSFPASCSRIEVWLSPHESVCNNVPR